MPAEMSGRQRILEAVAHREPDRVPVSPRVYGWLLAEFGDGSLERLLRELPEMDVMHIVGDGTPNYLFFDFPETYALPEVEVETRRHPDGDCEIVERTFRTPAGTLTDRHRLAPPGPVYGVNPNPSPIEHLVKGPEDLEALKYLLPPTNRNYDHLHEAEGMVGDRGVSLVYISSPVDHQAGSARGLTNLMMDYYSDRPLFDALIELFRQRTLEQTRAALEGGAQWIFGVWYFTSLSAGWSPAIFAEVFVPLIREHVDLVHSYGALYDYYDDGKLMDTMELIAGTGVDVLETCCPPPVGDMDLGVAKAKIGAQVTLKGYVDLLYVMQRGTPELVERTVAEAMEAAKAGGGFIIGSSDSWREGTPRENVAAYFRACREYGGYS